MATDAISRLLPLHGRTKLLELIRDIYHRFHVLHCSSGVMSWDVACFAPCSVLRDCGLSDAFRHGTNAATSGNYASLSGVCYGNISHARVSELIHRVSKLEQENAILKGSLRC